MTRHPGRGLTALVAAFAASCVPEAPAPDARFRTGVETPALVQENVTACEVDAVCGLWLGFADTVVFAVYGHGDVETPPCPVERSVSDAAFRAEVGDTVAVLLRDCPGVGLVLGALRQGPIELPHQSGAGRTPQRP